jgi:hypothetical protein
MAERPNYEVVQLDDDEFEVVTRDGRGTIRLTRAELKQLEAMRAAGPLPLDLD